MKLWAKPLTDVDGHSFDILTIGDKLNPKIDQIYIPAGNVCLYK